MLSLESPRWTQLQHAYGNASDIPGLLVQLKPDSRTGGKEEPWFSLWSALAHQGDIYSATFAAVPHVIEIFARSPSNASADFPHFAAWVEICRWKKAVEIPNDLAPDYHHSLSRMPSLIAASASSDWDEDFRRGALAALAACTGAPEMAEVILELKNENMPGLAEKLAFGE